MTGKQIVNGMIILAVIIAVVLAAHLLGRAKSTPTSVAVCNPQAAFDNYEKAIAQQAAWNKEVAQTREQIQAMATQIANKQKVLDSMRTKSGKQYEKLVEELAVLKAHQATFVKTRSADLDRAKLTIRNTGLADVRAAARKLAWDKGYSVVLTTNSTLFVNYKLDITAAVIKVLNENNTATK